MENEREIGFEIKSLSNLIRHCIDEQALNNDEELITGMQGWVIGYLYYHGDAQETFQKDLEKEFNIRRSTATGILQVMEKNGLITKEAVEYDARLKKLKLTPKAIRIHQQFTKTIEIVEGKLRKDLSKEEVKMFFSIMDKMKSNII